MMETILYLYHTGKTLISQNVPISKLTDAGMFEMLIKMKYEVENDRLDKFNDYISRIDSIAAAVKS